MVGNARALQPGPDKPNVADHAPAPSPLPCSPASRQLQVVLTIFPKHPAEAGGRLGLLPHHLLICTRSQRMEALATTRGFALHQRQRQRCVCPACHTVCGAANQAGKPCFYMLLCAGLHACIAFACWLIAMTTCLIAFWPHFTAQRNVCGRAHIMTSRMCAPQEACLSVCIGLGWHAGLGGRLATRAHGHWNGGTCHAHSCMRQIGRVGRSQGSMRGCLGCSGHSMCTHRDVMHVCPMQHRMDGHDGMIHNHDGQHGTPLPHYACRCTS